MITIEVLISLVILFLVVTTMTMSLKQFSLLRHKQINYEQLYINVLSIKNKIDTAICTKNRTMQGKLNGYEYRAVCKQIKSLRSYTLGDEDIPKGNNGRWQVTLYDVNLTLQKNNFEKSYVFAKTVLKKAL